MCLSEIYNNANWISIQSGRTSNGTCIANYYGSPTRQCIQNGTTGVWDSTVSDPCAGLFSISIYILNQSILIQSK